MNITENITKITRNESYQNILSELGERHRLCIEGLEELGKASANELAKYLFSKGLVASPERNSVHPRLNELVGKNIVQITGKEKDIRTNRNVAIYALVPN